MKKTLLITILLLTSPIYLSAQVTPYFSITKCNSSGDGTATFNLWEPGSAKSIILAAQTSDNVELFVFNALAEAQEFDTIGLSNAQQMAYANTSNPQTLYYVVLDVNNGNATAIGSFTLSVVSELDSFPNVSACDTYVLPSLSIGKYFTGPSGTGNELPFGTAITEDSTIYIYEANCGNSVSFDVNISNALTLADVHACDNYVLPYLEGVNYYVNSDMQDQIQPGTEITQNTNIYAQRVNSDPQCSSGTYFNVFIDYSMFVDEFGINSIECAQNGIGQFHLNTAVYSQFPELEVTYHATMDDAETGSSALPLLYTNTVPYIQTVYVRFYNGECAKVYPFDLIVNHVGYTQPAPVGVCDQDGDGEYNANYADFDSTAFQITFFHPQSSFEGFYATADAAITGEQPLEATFSGTAPVIYGRVSSMGCTVAVAVPLNIIIGCSMAVDDYNDLSYKLYPNPASHEITIETEHSGEQLVTLRDVAGKTIMIRNFTGRGNFDISGLAKGMYFVTIQAGDLQTTSKLLLK